MLTEEQILQPERTDRKIEEHFGCPQDIEWCFGSGHSSNSLDLYIVQSQAKPLILQVSLDRGDR